MAIHLMKLVVGFESLRQFATWQAQERIRVEGKSVNFLLTRSTPTRAEEILASEGSIYRIIKGTMCCRQKIIGFDKVKTSHGEKCMILMSPEIIRTAPLPRRAFQGWRYLKPEATPKDIAPYDLNAPEPDSQIEAELNAIGLL